MSANRLDRASKVEEPFLRSTITKHHQQYKKNISRLHNNRSLKTKRQNEDDEDAIYIYMFHWLWYLSHLSTLYKRLA